MADYDINAVPRKVSYTGSAGLGPYAFSFEVLTEDDVAVYFNETLLTKTTDYTVTVNANGTGSVTIVTGGNVPSTPTASDLVVIVGARDIERTTDFVTAGDLRASALNEQLDALTIMVQQVAEEVERSVKAPVFDPTGINMILPKKADRVNAFIAFDANGDVSAAVPSDDVTTLAEVATDIATLADIEDGTVATDTIQTVSGISTDVTTVSGISADVTIVAADQADIGTVATNLNGSDTIGTVAGSIANVNATGSNIASVNTVAGELGAGQDVTVVAADLSGTDTIGTVAGSIANVNTVAGEIGVGQDVTVVAANIADVGTVATNIANVNTTATNIANVNTTASINADVTAVANIDSDVSAVAADSADIGAVATNIVDVSAVAGIEQEVDYLANDITGGTFAPGIMYDLGSITEAAEGLPGVPNGYIVTVYTNLNDIVAVSNAIGSVQSVAAITGDVTTVAGIDSDVSTVAGVSGNVTTVAGVSANVTTVAGISANVTSVANIAADVTTASNNIVAIQNAPQAASDAADARDKAQKWANELEDVEVEPGEFSAFHWAQKAQGFAQGDALNISYDSTTSGLSATNVQAAIDEVVSETAALNGGNTFTGNQTVTGDVTITGTLDCGSIA